MGGEIQYPKPPPISKRLTRDEVDLFDAQGHINRNLVRSPFTAAPALDVNIPSCESNLD